MKEENFERELPKNYRVVKVIDEKNVNFISLIIVLIISVLVLAIGFLPLIFQEDKLSNIKGFPLLCGILGAVVYAFLHEIIHGIAYKIRTGEKFSFILNTTGVFCGAPKIFTYKRDSIFALLLPFIVFSLLLLPVFIVTYFYYVSVYVSLLVVLILHIISSLFDIHVCFLLSVRYKNNITLLNDSNYKKTIFIFDDTNNNLDDEKTVEFLNEFNSKKEIVPIDEKSLSTKAKALSVVCIVLFSLLLLFHSLIAFNKNNMLYPIDELRFYESVSFYVCLFSIAVIVISSLTMRKFYKVKLFLIILIAIIALPITMISALQSNAFLISHTTDVNNYGIYDDEYMKIDHFPEQITDNMIPVHYSYYYDYTWDYCYELYLEVKITDGEYESIKSKYESELKDCFYASNYSEYVISDYTNNYIREDGSCYMNSPHIRKIIFNDSDQTIIFVSICGIDPFYYENSYYFERFNLDPIEYSNYLKENKNESD